MVKPLTIQDQNNHRYDINQPLLGHGALTDNEMMEHMRLKDHFDLEGGVQVPLNFLTNKPLIKVRPRDNFPGAKTEKFWTDEQRTIKDTEYKLLNDI